MIEMHSELILRGGDYMGQAGLEKDKKTLPATEQETSLKGTLIFVLSIGSFILITWFAIFYLFVGRI
jgi:hypothetical protein